MKSPLFFRSLLWFIGATISAAPGHAAVTARGSDSTIKTVQALAEAFQKKTGTAVQVDGGGSGAGAKAALAGEVQVAFLSRALEAKEKDAGLVGVAYAADAVAVIVHQGNPIADVTIAQLKEYFTGTNAAWADGRPIVLYNRNADSGTREIFQDKVLGKGVAFSPTAATKHDGVLLGAVAKIPASLAYDGYGHADPKVVKIISVNGVVPTPETIRSAVYPLTRIPTLATKGEAGGDAKAFIDFALSPEGQAIIAANGLLTLQ